MKTWTRTSSESDSAFSADRWESFSDLMAALLLIFALILSAIMLVAAQERVKSIRQQRELTSKRRELNEIRREAEERLGVRKEIVELLKDKLEAYNVEVDPSTGAIRIGDKVLFAEDEDIVTENGKLVLDKVMRAYRTIFFDADYSRYLSRIIIEGHTNDNGSYLYNLDLSQRRAFNVMHYLIQSYNDTHIQNELKDFMVASGRSYMDLIHQSDGTVDKVKSRRIEVKFTLKDEQSILELKNMLHQVKDQ